MLESEKRPSRKTYWIVFSFLFCGLPLLVIGPLSSLLFNVSQNLRGSGLAGDCVTRLRKLGQAMEMYSVTNNGYYPPSSQWIDATWRIVGEKDPENETGSPFRCPVAWRDEAQGYGYAFNVELDGLRRPDVPDPDNTAVVFDSKLLMRNAASDLTTLPQPPRHRDGTRNHGVSVNGSILLFDPQNKIVGTEQMSEDQRPSQ